MAFVAGNFDDAAYNKAKITMAEIMADKFAHGHLHQEAPIFNAVTSRQGIRIGGTSQMVLADGHRCEGVDVSWLNICDLDVSTGTVDCELDGDEMGAQKKTYLNNMTFHKAYKVPKYQCKDVHELNEKRALAMLAGTAALDQELERRIIDFLNANADTLTGITVPVGSIDGSDATEWDIPQASVTTDVIIDFEKVVKTLNMLNPFIVDGNNFYSLLAKAEARYNGQNGGCCNTDALLKKMPIINNFKTVDQESGELRTFLVDGANVGYFNTTVNQNSSPIKLDDKDNTSVWRIPSKTLSYRNGNEIVPVMYDVKMQLKCISGHDYEEVYHFEHRGAFITGGSNCDARNGIVKITVNP